MSSAYIPPAISIAYDMETDSHILMATSHARTAIVGPRIFRAEPWPAVKFSHATQADAERDAATLRGYLEECASGKRKETKQRQRGYWED